MQRIIKSLGLLIGSVAVITAGVTGAFFSDTETSANNTFTAGAVDLKVDNESYYLGLPSPSTSWELVDLTTQKFFNFLDLKPGDWGEDTISLHVIDNDAYLCADITLTSDADNTQTEPEAEPGVDPDGLASGELAEQVNFIWWADDGDNVREVGEPTLSPSGAIGLLPLNQPYTVALADTSLNIWNALQAPGPVDGGETHYIGKAWCFGAIGDAALPPGEYTGPDNPANDLVDEDGPATPEDGGITCDQTGIGNESQTDTLTADISFRAVQSRNNSDFLCVPDDTPEFGACEAPGLAWADSVVVADQGRRQDGSAILATRVDPSKALGAPETTGTPMDAVPPGSTFYALGFNTATTATRSITLRFDDNVILNDNGVAPDLRVYEVTGGTYPDELARVEASKDGVSWTILTPDANRDEDFDLGVLDWARYVRVTDLSNAGDPQWTARPDADGYDLDGLQALSCGVEV